MSGRFIHRVVLSCAVALFALGAPLTAAAQISVSITVAPPELPVYDQPPLPAPGYIWTPGYWAYGPDGYFWVPGTWVEPPQPELLWTPGYWGWSDGVFVWNAGYWAPQIGFYGGVNYGFGYTGQGYAGGYWRGGQLYYNTTVTNVTNVQVRNVYTQTVVNNVTINKVSYNGGPGGVTARPTPQEEQVARGPHTPPTAMQTQQRTAASSRHDLLASVNNGKPQIAATARPGDFSRGAVAAREGGRVNTAPAKGGEERPASGAPAPAAHARDLKQPAPAARQQSDMEARQERERAALAAQQDKEHAAFAQKSGAESNNKSNPAFQQMEQRHQQQTQQLQQRQAAERSKQAKPEPPRPAKPDDHKPQGGGGA